MDKKYQSISRYDGSLTGRQNNYENSLYGEPRYEGIEYDWEVPDNLVIGSPGGVSTIHHHYTKGFDGRGNTSADLFAGQGERYNSGIYGNLYQTGQEAGQHMGYYPAAPDYQFWQNEQPSQYSYSNSISSTWAPFMKTYGQPGAYETYPDDLLKKKELEMYTSDLYSEDSNDGFELVQQADTKENEPQGGEIISNPKNVFITRKIEPWLLFLFFIMAFIAFDFWAEAGHLFINEKFGSGKKLTWQRSVMYAVIITLLFAFIIWIFGIPISEFEIQ